MGPGTVRAAMSEDSLNSPEGRTWLPWFRDQASALGLKAWPSAGNFVLLGFPTDTARGADAACRFLNERGIIPRRMASYGLPDCLRFTIGGEAEMRAVVEALAAFVAARG